MSHLSCDFAFRLQIRQSRMSTWGVAGRPAATAHGRSPPRAPGERAFKLFTVPLFNPWSVVHLTDYFSLKEVRDIFDVYGDRQVVQSELAAHETRERVRGAENVRCHPPNTHTSTT